MNKYQEIISYIKNADAILVSASNGFSITEGLHLFAENQAFEELFGDIKHKYGIRNILQGLFTKWPSEEEKWGYQSRLISHFSGSYTGSAVMDCLKTVIGNTPYFIVTSNGEGHFTLAGFETDRIYEIEGNWLTMQCAHACHPTLYPTMEHIKKMAATEKGGTVPTELIPHCPKCGGPMQIHVPLDEYFIPNTATQKRFEQFLQQYHGKKLVVLELGIGWRNQMIKAPLMRLVHSEPKATYVTINKGEIYIPNNISEKSFGVDGDLASVLEEIAENSKEV